MHPVAEPSPNRLAVDVHIPWCLPSTLAADVRAGLTGRNRMVPSKYLYDDYGTQLFERICHQPEYYLSRTEQALLDRTADRILKRVRPADLLELGCGSARKTRALFDAAHRNGLRVRYVPIDLNEGVLRRAAMSALETWPWLTVHGVVGDFEHHLEHLPPGGRRLVAFLGNTLGNLAPPADQALLDNLARLLEPGDWLLLGVDLVRDPARLHAAYNDAAGVTADFNLNLLRVLNRELWGNFDLESFAHHAFFNEAASRVEMHLRSRRPQAACLKRIGLEVRFREGETVCTELSRKFSRDQVTGLLAGAGFELEHWFTPDDNTVALALARLGRRPATSEQISSPSQPPVDSTVPTGSSPTG